MLGGGAQEEQRVNRPLTIAAQEIADDYECMERSVDELYGKMDAVFVEKGVLSISCPDRRRLTDNKMLNGVCFELIRRDLVPFSIDMVNKAMRTALGLTELQGLRSAGEFKTDAHFREEKSEGDFETVMSSFLATHSSTGMAEIKVRKVVRRYAEGSRTAFIYQTFMEPRLFN